MPINKDINNIKASVNGNMDDVPPAPSPSSEVEVITESEPATTEVSEEYDKTTKEYSEEKVPLPSAPASIDIERIHELTESVVNERWDEFVAKIGDLPSWKEKVNMNVLAIKQEIVRLNDRLNGLQNSIVGKVRDYDQGIREIHSEMKALEKVFERIVEPLTANIKQLERITKELKNIK